MAATAFDEFALGSFAPIPDSARGRTTNDRGSSDIETTPDQAIQEPYVIQLQGCPHHSSLPHAKRQREALIHGDGHPRPEAGLRFTTDASRAGGGGAGLSGSFGLGMSVASPPMLIA